MIFTNPFYLQIGIGLCALAALGLWSHTRRRRKLANFLGGPRAAARLSGTSLYRFRLERALLLGGAAFALAVAAAEPRFPDRSAPIPPQPPAARVLFVLDVSVSMQARDETPTRLGRATAVVEELLPALEDEQVGLLLFAGKPYPLAPPTHDHRALRYLLDGVVPTIASAWDPGSLPSAAIEDAVRNLAQGDSAAARSIILISDGEAGEASRSLTRATEAAANAEIVVHTIGVGSERGIGMSLPSGAYQLGGPVLTDAGDPATTRFRRAALEQIAATGGGRYAHASDAAALATLRLSFARPPPPTIELQPQNLLERYDLTTLFAAAALVLLLTESLLDIRLPGSGLAPSRRPARRPA